MKKIDTLNWKSVKISNLFDVVQETADNQAQRILEGDIPLVSAGKSNNGIVKRIENPVEGSRLFPMFTITVDMFGKAFLQTECFYAVSHARVNMLIPKYERMKCKQIGLFLVSVISKKFEEISSYNSMCGKSRIQKETLLLPVDNDDHPDWEFMENYMAEIRDACIIRESDLNRLRKITPQKQQVKQWKNFKLGGPGGIFKIHKGTRLTKANMIEGDYPFVGASAKCNGITRFVGNGENLITGNKLTINYNGSIGESFWQDKDFLASDDVNWCEPNTDAFPNFKLNRYVAHFLCSITKRIGKRYQYIDKWTKDNMEKDLIMLPVSENGEPDWEYMENYMREIESQCNEKLDTLMSIM